MRKILILSLLLLCSSSLFAGDPPEDRWRISVLAAEISTDTNNTFAGHTFPVDDSRVGVGLGIAYVPAPQWDVEFTVASQTHHSPYTRVFYAPMPDGQPGMLIPATEFHEYRVTPMDVSVTRHFLTDQAIAPYVRAGLRYVAAPDDPAPVESLVPNFPGTVLIQVSEGYGLNDRVSAQAGAGVRLRLTPRTAFRAEATRLLRSQEADFDPLMRYAAGLSWVF
ncbi:MAG TPA: hypothetical protein VF432_23250 [Thermoanaerobaculia bacterium]